MSFVSMATVQMKVQVYNLELFPPYPALFSFLGCRNMSLVQPLTEKRSELFSAALHFFKHESAYLEYPIKVIDEADSRTSFSPFGSTLVSLGLQLNCYQHTTLDKRDKELGIRSSKCLTLSMLATRFP